MMAKKGERTSSAALFKNRSEAVTVMMGNWYINRPNVVICYRLLISTDKTLK